MARIYARICSLIYIFPAINIVLFYFGLCNEENTLRELIFNGAYLLIDAIIVLLVMESIKTKVNREGVLLLWIIFAVTVACVFSAFLMWGNRTPVFSYLTKFFLIGIPSLLAGTLMGWHCSERWFLKTIDMLTVFVLPACVIYLYMYFTNQSFRASRGLGILSYMTYAYALLPFLLVKMYMLERQTQVVKKLFNCFAIALLLINIFLTGTRGALVAFGAYLVVKIIVNVKKKKPVGIYCFVIIAAVLFVLFNAYVYTIPGFEVIYRFKITIDGLMHGKLVTTDTQAPEISNMLESIVKSNGVVNVNIGDRGTMYKLAILEYLKSPVVGMGPMGYSVKYGIYPHNAFLEILAETGIIGTLPLMAVFFIAIKRSWNSIVFSDENEAIFTLLICAVVKACISGSVWQSSELLIFIGWALFCSKQRVTRKELGKPL